MQNYNARESIKRKTAKKLRKLRDFLNSTVRILVEKKEFHALFVAKRHIRLSSNELRLVIIFFLNGHARVMFGLNLILMQLNESGFIEIILINET